ncbi:MAG: hypothetical protein IJQ12_01090 [Lachnospiraceae bacterium]|nr:hypothetical protein [Lachnospiraceae bacterium]
MVSEYTLPPYTMDDINAFLEQKERYLQEPTVRNKQWLAFYYDRAYTAVKHLVVCGVIPQSEMWNIVHRLKAIPEEAAG